MIMSVIRSDVRVIPSCGAHRSGCAVSLMDDCDRCFDLVFRAIIVRERERTAKLFESIQIRCREGSPDVDWLPIIDRLATEGMTGKPFMA